MKLMEILLLGFLVFVLTAFMIFVIISKWQYFNLFDYDETNPYRRYCRKCGQQQDAFTYDLSQGRQWCEDMGAIKDPDCKCHDYVRIETN